MTCATGQNSDLTATQRTFANIFVDFTAYDPQNLPWGYVKSYEREHYGESRPASVMGEPALGDQEWSNNLYLDPYDGEGEIYEGAEYIYGLGLRLLPKGDRA